MGDRKKRESSQRANAAVEAIKKAKKLGKPAAKVLVAKPELTPTAAAFLSGLKEEVTKTTKAMVDHVNQRTAPTMDKTSGQ